MVLISVRLSVLITFLAQLKHLALGALVKITADHSPVGDEDSAVEPVSSVEHEIDDLGGGADDNVSGGGSINSVEHELDDPGGGSITSADADSALLAAVGAVFACIVFVFVWRD